MRAAELAAGWRRPENWTPRAARDCLGAMRRCSVVFVAFALACGSSAPSDPDGGPDAATSAPAASTVIPSAAAPSTTSAPVVGPRIAVPAGVVLAGSRPGTPWRRPAWEADLAPIDVPAFEIDRRAEADPGRADARRVTAEVAAATCSARGARLCDELEWERACEGDAHRSLPTAGSWADCAAHPEGCTSGFGAVAQGVLAPEWTRSGDRYVLRGARVDQDEPLHRCDARTPLETPEGREGAVRCCYGPAPSLAYPERRGGLPFTPLEIDLETLRAAMRSTPELAPYADDFTPFDTATAERAYTRADLVVDDVIRARLAAGPLLWSPANGERAWLFAGTSGEDTLIAVLYPLDGPEGAVVHGASFVFRERVPVAITPVPRERESVAWATAVGRAGESGFVRFDEDGVIRIVGQ